MTHLFEITHEDIARLDGRQLTDLLRRLLYLEAARFQIAASSVHVALNITVPDGGEDGRIQWSDGPERTDYVPNRLTLFQCKATDLGPKDCAKEVCRKNFTVLNPQVEQVLDVGGSYVLFTTQSLNSRQLTKRIAAIRDAVRDAGKSYADAADIHIYDANKIQAWTNRYLAAVTAVCQWCGQPPVPGMQTWEHWSGQAEYLRYPFVSSDDSDRYIKQLRSELAKPRAVARIVGLSGLGKTRLALEAFRLPSGGEVEDLHHRIVYLDAALGIPHLAAIVSDWVTHDLEGILVVDNCDLDLHQQLQNQVQHTHSRMNLLTLDNNPEEKASGVPIICMPRSPDSFIKGDCLGHPRKSH